MKQYTVDIAQNMLAMKAAAAAAAAPKPKPSQLRFISPSTSVNPAAVSAGAAAGDLQQPAATSPRNTRPLRTRAVTVQPGLEDVSAAAYERQAAGNEHNYDTHSKRSFFQFSGRGAAEEAAMGRAPGKEEERPAPTAANASVASNSSPSAAAKNATAANAAASGNSRPSRFSNRRKSLNANPELSKLRSQIAAKEYELQRLEKIAKKKSTTAGTTGADVSASNVDLKTVQEAIMELREMKNQYRDLAGVEYEHQTPRKLFSFGKGSGGLSMAIDGSTSSSANQSMSSNNTPFSSSSAIASGQLSESWKRSRTDLPSHWMQPQPLSGFGGDVAMGAPLDRWDRLRVQALMVAVFSVALFLSTAVY